MSIADKLLYLNETKTALREALNAAGANITTDTTFRDYAAWVDYVAWLQSGGPLNLFANGEQGVWYDPSDLTTLFQDAAGTTPVTADGDPVGLMLDKSGNGNHATQPVSADRPIYRTDGVLHWLAFNGTNQILLATPLGALSTGTTLIAACFSGSPHNGTMFSMGNGNWSSGGNSQTLQFITSGGSRASGTNGISERAAVLTGQSAGVYQGNFDKERITHKSPHGEVSTTFEWETQNYSDSLAVGGLRGASRFLNGGFYGGAIRVGVLSSTEEAATTKYLAKLAGVTL